MKCTNCGNEIAENAKFCRECGTEVVFKTEALNENLCKVCGNVLEDGALFCNNCGSKTGEQELNPDAGISCPACGKMLKPNAVFCGECGASVSGHNLKNEIRPKEPEKQNKKDRGFGVLLAALIVVVIACAATVTIVYLRNNALTIETPNIENDGVKNITENSDDKKANEEKPKSDVIENEQPTTSPENESIFLFPSDKEYITENDLRGKTQDEVALIRNEIYARHGYIFNTEPFRSYFEVKDWYSPNENFSDAVFNSVEKANKDYLVAYEKEKGWR